jgi:hypothetical protein
MNLGQEFESLPARQHLAHSVRNPFGIPVSRSVRGRSRSRARRSFASLNSIFAPQDQRDMILAALAPAQTAPKRRFHPCLSVLI